MTVRRSPHTSHWGAFTAVVEDGVLTGVEPFADDPAPSPLLENIAGSVRHRARIAGPMVRAGWLEHGPGPDSRRGTDRFVPVSWEAMIDLLAGELRRVYATYGPEAVYGGSYGWASAGRFHHAQSQLHRFLNCLGGYVRSVNSYSNAAGEVILDRVTGSMRRLLDRATTWTQVVEHAELVVAFGGMPLKNSLVSPGGVTRHRAPGQLQAAAERGVEFVLFSPQRDDLPAFVNAEWQPLRPGSDVAVMLGLAHTLVVEGLHDRAFLASHCAGFERFARYLLGDDDGVPKSADWAANLSGVPGERIRTLARRMAAARTLVNVSWSLQRADHGEQPPWMGLTLAAMLGQVGLPGGGFGFGYGALGYVGEPANRHGLPTLPQGRNPVQAFIPVARVADMLLHPGEPFDYDGARLTYPEIRLVYWCGGNPFHHHQDLGRLRRALARPETIVVHDPFWTPTARHADFVIPVTVTLERDDIGAAKNDPYLIAMHRALPPYAGARDDYATFADLAAALGVGQAFTEGRTEGEWLRVLYGRWRAAVERAGTPLPDFDAFWRAGSLRLPDGDEEYVAHAAFRADPVAAPLPTPSGKIEIYSETIASFGYADCLGHPAWFEPAEWLGGEGEKPYPLQLIAVNPRTRLHSQLDTGAFSQASKVGGREPVRIHPDDAAARGIRDGEIVRLFNDRGTILAGAVLSREIMAGVVQLSTGAWNDPPDPAEPDAPCFHGNPNVLTRDAGTSRLAQGCSGQHALVEVEAWHEGRAPGRLSDSGDDEADRRA